MFIHLDEWEAKLLALHNTFLIVTCSEGKRCQLNFIWHCVIAYNTYMYVYVYSPVLSVLIALFDLICVACTHV